MKYYLIQQIGEIFHPDRDSCHTLRATQQSLDDEYIVTLSSSQPRLKCDRADVYKTREMNLSDFLFILEGFGSSVIENNL